jgi:GNAT superfamily N-acetyltransferase
MIELEEVTSLAGLVDDLVTVYRSAFQVSPYFESDEDVLRFAGSSLPRHSERDGFRLAVARQDGEAVGFGYGYTSAPGQWWHDRVVEALGEPARAALPGAFELVTLAVLGDRQGRGIGGALHDRLVDGVERAALSTLDGDTPARALYLRRGWRTLGRMRFSPAGRHLLILLR